MSERSWAEIGGSGRVGLSQVIREPNDNYTRANAADIATNAPFGYTKMLNSPDNITAEIASNKAHNPNTAGLASVNRADTEMTSTDHSVTIRLATATWNATNDVVGVIARGGGAGDRTAYGFWVWRLAGPVYTPRYERFAAGAIAGQLSDTNLGSPPAAGDYLKLVISGFNITGWISTAGAAFVKVLDKSDAGSNISDGFKGGFALQRGSAGSDFAIDGLWLDRAPF